VAYVTTIVVLASSMLVTYIECLQAALPESAVPYSGWYSLMCIVSVMLLV